MHMLHIMVILGKVLLSEMVIVDQEEREQSVSLYFSAKK